MDLFKALGIIYIVAGHYYQPSFLVLNAYSFHVALFFFASGYFFKPVYGTTNILQFVKSKAHQLLIPYFKYTTFFVVLTVLLDECFHIRIGNKPTFYNFFIQPFINGQQYAIGTPMWFVPTLFISMTFLQIIYRNREKSLRTDLIYVILGVTATYVVVQWSYSPTGKYSIKLVIIRTIFSSLFLLFGMIYRAHLERYKNKLFTSVKCFAAFVLYTILKRNYPVLKYHLAWGNFLNYPFWLPILTSCVGIYIHLFISDGLSHYLRESDVLYSIGMESFKYNTGSFMIIRDRSLFTGFLSEIAICTQRMAYYCDNRDSIENLISSSESWAFWF